MLTGIVIDVDVVLLLHQTLGFFPLWFNARDHFTESDASSDARADRCPKRAAERESNPGASRDSLKSSTEGSAVAPQQSLLSEHHIAGIRETGRGQTVQARSRAAAER